MTVTEYELMESRRGHSSYGNDAGVTYTWRCKGSTLFTAAVLQVQSVAPASVLDPISGVGLVQDRYSWQPVTHEIYDVSVDYVNPVRQDEKKQLEENEIRFAWDSTGGNVHITESLETIGSYHRVGGPAAQATNKAIGIKGDGTVQGVSIVVPSVKLTISFRYASGVVTDTFGRTIEGMTAKTNNATFWGRAEGSLLFLGWNGSMGSATGPQWDLHFAYSPNVASFDIGDIVGIAKKGHQYVWVYYQSEQDTSVTPNRSRPVPVWAKVERVYEAADFSTFGVGIS